MKISLKSVKINEEYKKNNNVFSIKIKDAKKVSIIFVFSEKWVHKVQK